MSVNGRRMGLRDYKRPHGGGLRLDAAQLRGFALGLGLGLLVAAIVYIGDHRVRAAIADPLRPVPQRRAPDELGLSRIDAGTRPAAAADAAPAAHAATPADAADADTAGQQDTETPAERSGRAAASAAVSAPAAASASARGQAPAGQAAAAPAATVGRFDFYQMLPRARVLVAAHEHISSIAPTAPVQQPGTYFLQVGSYRDAALAGRVRAEVARLGILATVQRVAVGSDVWDRVRVGPLRDLATLNRMRRQLQAAKLGSLVVRMEN